MYLNDDWQITDKSPFNDCYVMVEYKYWYENILLEDRTLNLVSHRAQLRLSLESLYHKNEHAFQVKLCFLRAAFSKVCTGKMMFEIGAGGDGKGMEAYLDKNLLGSHQTTTLDCGVFLDRQEFRKSGEFVWGKCNVRIQEMDSHGRFIADIWKRFVVDEEIDCRVNYGFTSKRKFGDSMKIQELNYENVPVIEEVRDRLKACEHLKRRVVCLRMGKAQFVTDMDQVDHEKGIYKLLPQDELIAFLSHPLTASLYFRDWCLPFFSENTMDECLQMIANLGLVHPDLVTDTEWLANRLSGASLPPPGAAGESLEDHAELIGKKTKKTGRFPPPFFFVCVAHSFLCVLRILFCCFLPPGRGGGNKIQ